MLVWEWVHVHKCAHTCGVQSSSLGDTSLSITLFDYYYCFFVMWCPISLELSKQVDPGIYLPLSPSNEMTKLYHHSWLTERGWDLNSRLCACVTSLLLTMLSV